MSMKDNKEQITMKLWAMTLRKFRIIAAYTDETMVEMLDRLATQELDRVEKLEDVQELENPSNEKH